MRATVVLAAALAGAAALATGAAPSLAETEGLIAIETGTLAIVLSAPHGGTAPIPGVTERKSGTRVRDEHTGEIAVLVATELERELGARPSVVRALFHRKFLDANRKESEAFEDPDARPVYAAYHGALRGLVDAARKKSGRGLLVDLHGQNKLPEALVRGTRDGKTVTALLARAGVEALSGPRSVFGKLAASGYRIDPAGDGKENDSFDGGFIVATYGSHHEGGIDAIQIEIGRALRHEPGPRKKLARDLALAIAAFHRAYIAKP